MQLADLIVEVHCNKKLQTNLEIISTSVKRDKFLMVSFRRIVVDLAA